MAFVISSSGSSTTAPSFTRCFTSVSTFLLNIWLAWPGTVLGMFTGPMIVTPFACTSSPARVSSQLPPLSAARSTITAPGFMLRTISAVSSLGAKTPPMSAVVITTSD